MARRVKYFSATNVELTIRLSYRMVKRFYSVFLYTNIVLTLPLKQMIYNLVRLLKKEKLA